MTVLLTATTVALGTTTTATAAQLAQAASDGASIARADAPKAAKKK